MMQILQRGNMKVYPEKYIAECYRCNCKFRFDNDYIRQITIVDGEERAEIRCPDCKSIFLFSIEELEVEDVD